MHVYKLILSYSHSFIRSFIHLSLIHTPTENFNQPSKNLPIRYLQGTLKIEMNPLVASSIHQ